MVLANESETGRQCNDGGRRHSADQQAQEQSMELLSLTAHFALAAALGGMVGLER